MTKMAKQQTHVDVHVCYPGISRFLRLLQAQVQEGVLAKHLQLTLNLEHPDFNQERSLLVLCFLNKTCFGDKLGEQKHH